MEEGNGDDNEAMKSGDNLLKKQKFDDESMKECSDD